MQRRRKLGKFLTKVTIIWVIFKSVGTSVVLCEDNSTQMAILQVKLVSFHNFHV